MLENLTNRLSRVVKQIKGQARLTESNIQDALREVRMALLEADVALPVVKAFVEGVKERALGQDVLDSLTPGQALVGVVHDELKRLMGDECAELNLAAVPPAVILMAGLQGVGKTTTTGKLAGLLKNKHKKKVLLVSTDVYRPAAIEQLDTLGKALEIDCFSLDKTAKPLDIAKAALDHAKRYFYDVLMVDTAGRLGIDTEMMNEITALHRELNPIETLFVVDAMQGQDAVNTALAFNQALPLTGVILTKLDGDARGGAALSVRHITGKPIKFVGVGEKLEALEPFYPERMASRILGMGDVLSLIDNVKQHVDQKEVAKMAKKMQSGKGFDLEDFKTQILQMRKMGGVNALMDKMPGQISRAKMPQNAGEEAEKGMRRTEAIINSMTPLERSKPEILKASRKRRIASGAGVSVQEVNKLLNQFTQMQTMMKQLKGGGKMAQLMRGLGGKFPGLS